MPRKFIFDKPSPAWKTKCNYNKEDCIRGKWTVVEKHGKHYIVINKKQKKKKNCWT